MAKKEVASAHQQKPSQKQEDSVKSGREITLSMDSEGLEKLESLKSLNQVLLKEVVERRQQVDSLVQSKASLESELSRSNSDSEVLMSELTRLGERAACLELERGVESIFVSVQMGMKWEESERKIKDLEVERRELKREIEGKEREILRLSSKVSETGDALGVERDNSKRVVIERDYFVVELNRQLEECKLLTERLTEFERREKVIGRDIDELRVSYSAVIGEKEDMEMRTKSLIGENESLERGLLDSIKSIEQMKEELRGIVREKEGIEEEKNAEMIKRQELENAVSGLDDFVSNLQKNEVKLHTIVAELDKKCVEGEERQRQMGRDIDELVEEKKLSEKRIRGLVDERTAIKNDFSEALKQLAEQKEKIEEMVNEKIVIMEAKGRVDSENGALQNQVDELKADVLKLEQSNRVYVETIKSLESEVEEFKYKLEQVNNGSDEVKFCLEEEKQKVVRLKEKIEELKSKIEDSQKTVVEVKADKDAILAEKKELETYCEKLENEISRLQNTIIEGQNELNSTKVKVELADANAELVLNMLEGTANFCSNYKSDNKIEFLGGGEEMKKYVKELETIKNAYMGKVEKVQEMEGELECLKNSIEDAHKKKSFWTVLSSATTLLAAVSVAYVARGH